jgi:hypothetical protein
MSSDKTTEPRGCPTPGACSALTEIARLRGILHAILYADERGQGVQFHEAMDRAAKEISYNAG